MKPTNQQEAVVAQRVGMGEILLLNAYAGTGKTTTLELIARSDPDRRYLYLCFNRDNAGEARKRFPPNCECSTIHSKAWHAVGRQFGELADLRPRIVMEVFHLAAPYLAVYVIDTLNVFLHSTDPTPEPQHVRTGPRTPEAARHRILSVTRKLWQRMEDPGDPAIPMSHDGYLKFWALQSPSIVGYDIIFLDEAQDTNPVTLEIVLAQAARKSAGVVLVGDTHQSIYAWRHAIDAMEQVAEFATWRLPMTESFRFGPGIAQDASIILNQLKGDPVTLIGRGDSAIEPSSFAVLARTNATLIGAAIDKARDGVPIHFSATSGRDDWDPFIPYKFQLTLDIYRLWNDQPRLVRDSYMKKFKSFAEVEEHARGEGEQRHGRDIELALQVELVKGRGDEIPELLDLLRRQSCGPDEATLTFSTVHRAKGREWDAVHLLDDFIDPTDEKTLNSLEPVVRAEESNILYVAVTRAKAKILYPQKLAEWIGSFDKPGTNTGHRLPPRPTTDRPTQDRPTTDQPAPDRPYRLASPLDSSLSVHPEAISTAIASLPLRKITDSLDVGIQRIRRRHPRAYEPWGRREDALLAEAWSISPDPNALATLFQRQPSAIRSRLQRLGLSR